MIDENILSQLPSPCWLLEEKLLKRNLNILKNIKDKTGVSILLALKGYALWKSFNIVKEYLDGCCASGLNEALLAYEEFGKDVHTYSPAFKKNEIKQIAKISNHLLFNSENQLNSFDIEGLHFHALCEEDSTSLKLVLEAFEEKFAKYLHKLKWVNFGGGHHITRDGYNIELLIELINNFKAKYPHLKIYIEPGEAVGWQTGTLIATVLDIVHNGIDIAILDTSAEAHMPDTIIMPYRAEVRDAKEPNVLKHTYRLAGNTCLAGDIMGDYSFNEPLNIGDKIIFEDQMHYTMVKATTFNGINLPTIAILKENEKVEILREFGYKDFKNRLS